MRYSEPPTTSKVQLNYRIIIIHNHQISCITEVLQLRIFKRGHKETGRRGRDAGGLVPYPHVSLKNLE